MSEEHSDYQCTLEDLERCENTAREKLAKIEKPMSCIRQLIKMIEDEILPLWNSRLTDEFWENKVKCMEHIVDNETKLMVIQMRLLEMEYHAEEYNRHINVLSQKKIELFRKDMLNAIDPTALGLSSAGAA